jgi:hypothetical protein
VPVALPKLLAPKRSVHGVCKVIAVEGRPVGTHRIFDREGWVIFAAHFPPPVRAH